MKDNKIVNRYLYVRETLYSSYGVRVIIDHLKNNIPYLLIGHHLKDIPEGSVVVPYGILESVDVIRYKRFELGLSLMVDAYSLGEWSNFAKTWNKTFIPFRYKITSFLRALKFFVLEYYVMSCYKRIMLVSWGDKEYYKRMPLFKKFGSKFIVVPNGVEIPVPVEKHLGADNSKLRIGCLSPWWGPSYYTLQFFLNDVWKKIDKTGLELVVAGRGMTPEKQAYIERFENVKVIGEVEKLEEFYEQVDVSLITMLKKCGIINRVLDGFSFGVPVMCRPESLLAFKDLPDCCYTYEDANSFMTAIKEIISNPNEALLKADKALAFVRKHHDWEKNYEKFSLEILKLD